MRYCDSCGTGMRDNAKFCPNCGVKMKPLKTKFCDECGAKILFTARVCPECGFSQQYGVESPEETQAPDLTATVVPAPATTQIVEPVAVEPIPIVVPVPTPVVQAPAEPVPQEKPKKEEGEKEKSLVTAIRCPQCGSTDVDMATETSGKCRHCGAGVVLDAKPKTVYNNVQLSVGTLNGNAPIEFFRLEGEKTEEQFEQSAYRAMAKDSETPTDIFEYTFYPVTKEEKNFILYESQIHLTYTAMVGVDYRVEYIDGEGKKQTKTETKWTPISGSFDDAQSTYLPDGDVSYFDLKDEKYEYTKHLSHALGDPAPRLVPFDGEGIMLTNTNRETATEIMKSSAAAKCKDSITGDHVKDFNYSGTVTMQSIRGYVVTEYSMAYKKDPNDQSVFVANGYETGDNYVYGHAPSDRSGINAEATLANLGLTIASVVLLFASVLVAFLVPVDAAVWAVSIVALVFFIVTLITQRVFRKKIIKERIAIKHKELSKFFKKKGWAVPEDVSEAAKATGETAKEPDPEPAQE